MKISGLGKPPAFAGQTADRPVRVRERSHELSVPRERRGQRCRHECGVAAGASHDAAMWPAIRINRHRQTASLICGSENSATRYYRIPGISQIVRNAIFGIAPLSAIDAYQQPSWRHSFHPHASDPRLQPLQAGHRELRREARPTASARSSPLSADRPTKPDQSSISTRRRSNRSVRR